MIQESRTSKAKKNIVYGMVNKIVTLVLSLVGRYIFLAILPIEYLGINGVFSDVLSMLCLADLGFATAMAYSFYKPLAEKDEVKLIALLSFYRKIYHIIAAVITVIGLALIPFLKYIINVDYEIPHLTLYYMIALFNTVVSYLCAYKQSLISADQKYYIISKYSMWIAFAKIILQTVILYMSRDYTAYLLVGIVTTIIYNLLLNHQANKYYPTICKQRGVLKQEERREVYDNMKSVVIYKISAVLLSGTDNALISMLVSTAAVGLYANYLTVINKIMQFVWNIFGNITASAGNLIAEGNREKIYQFFKMMCMCSFWVGSYICITLYYLTDEFIALWLGKEYVTSKLLLVMILCNTFYIVIRNPIGCFREAAGMYRKTRYIMLLCAIVNIVLSVILGWKWGTVGIILASFLARLGTEFWYETKVVYHEYFQDSCWKYYIELMRNMLVFTVAMIICGVILPIVNTHNVIADWLLKGFLCTIMINGIFLLYYGKTMEFRNLVMKICKK